MPVSVRREGSPRARLTETWAVRAGETILAALRLSAVELSIVLVDDRTMRRLNREHRDEDHATDVLSFPLWEGEGAALAEAGGLLGDVVLAVDVAAKQAKKRAIPLDEEATMLLAHGVLHLLGLDHRDRTEERRMTARTDALRSTVRRRR
jgi:probable rRNA maturation factor